MKLLCFKLNYLTHRKRTEWYRFPCSSHLMWTLFLLWCHGTHTSIRVAELTNHLGFKPIDSELPDGLVVRIPDFHWQGLGSWVQSLIRELRSLKMHSAAKNKTNKQKAVIQTYIFSVRQRGQWLLDLKSYLHSYLWIPCHTRIF